MDHLFAAFHDELEKIALSPGLKRRAFGEARRRATGIATRARRRGVEGYGTTMARDRRVRQRENFKAAINQPVPRAMLTHRVASTDAAKKVEDALGIEARPVFSSSLKRRN